jgi:NADPH2:quinone reductase
VRAVQVSRHGGPEELILGEHPDPVPGPGEVLVRNSWIGVNYVDLQHRAGRPYPVELPLIPGTEAAGFVTEVGDGVDPGLAGAAVVHFGHLRGVYAELTAVPAEFVVPLPAGVALDDAAAVAMNGTTAYVLTAMACQIGPGDVVVVHAAAGATGGAVVQLAAAAGAEVIALASTAAKAGAAVALGARHGLALEQVGDPVAAVLSVTGGRGADVVYDANGRDTFGMSLDMLATFGTLVLYGQSSGPVEPFGPGRLSGITGEGRGAGSLTLRWVAASHYLAGQPDRAAAVSAVLGQVGAGRLSPRIAERYPLGRAAEAHSRLASRSVAGKILLQVGSDGVGVSRQDWAVEREVGGANG